MESIVSLLRSACEEVGDVEFRESYSGRGMYGRECVGIVGMMDDCFAVIAHVQTALTQELFDTAIDAADGEENAAYDLNDKVQEMQRSLMRISYDSMGRDVIVYWTAIAPEPIPLPTDDELDTMSLGAVAQFLKRNEEYVTEDDSMLHKDIRATAKIVRDRIKEDQSE